MKRLCVCALPLANEATLRTYQRVTSSVSLRARHAVTAKHGKTATPNLPSGSLNNQGRDPRTAEGTGSHSIRRHVELIANQQ